MNIDEFFDHYMQELDIEAGAKSKPEAFMDNIADTLIASGEIEEFNYCHYDADKGVRVDGYSIDPDIQDTVILFISDLVQGSEKFESINKTEIDAVFKRLTNFYKSAIKDEFLDGREETSPEYNLAFELASRKSKTKKLKLYLFTNKKISDRIDMLEDTQLDRVKVSYQIWDLSRIHALHSSSNVREILTINFDKLFNETIPCLRAHDDNSDNENSVMKSYLAVVPGKILAGLYEKYGNRLLEANVRCFLQQKGKVNKGIKHTIMKEPEKFFAFNNGLTATAQDIKLRDGKIEELTDLQIVNGAQTTASLFHTFNKEQNIELEKIYVQMKLTIMPKSQDADMLVVDIARYANTQNKVTDADFFTNHPYHLRIEEKSRRKFLEPKHGEVKPTKWWYERARGSYNNEMSLMTVAEKKKFQSEYPSKQKFDKEDLAKYENVWDEEPKYCNLGKTKNFAQFAKRISSEWEKNDTIFNDNYYSRLIARAIIFKSAQKIVFNQDWYSGYRANIVYYTIAIISQILKKRSKAIDHMQIWKHQEIDSVLIEVIEIISKHVNNELVHKQLPNIANIGEKAKRDIFWTELQKTIPSLSKQLPREFFKSLRDIEDIREDEKEHKINQSIDNRINDEIYVMNKGHAYWKELYDSLNSLEFDLTSIERDILILAAKPGKLLSEKQCKVIKSVEDRAAESGVKIN